VCVSTPLRLDANRAVPFARDLARHGTRPALITADATLTYRDLADRVEEVARLLGERRRLVLLAGANTVDAVVAYLGALAGGHPVLLAPAGTAERSLVAAYDPDVIVRTGEQGSARVGRGRAGLLGEPEFDERRAVSAHAPHPDLALLLSTSGSTGSPKLVRLSHDNLQANAESIATYLGIGPDDRAATTLPMHYCYGLSVVNSHLLRGAGLILTDLSVADGCFWDLFREHRGTSFAGVPYTFELLDRVGFAGMRLPHLRYVTQAGGRLTPERVAEYAALGERDGWDLYVMYGQTEATARMAYLPPELARSRPQAIGVPIPGGSFRLDPLPDATEPDTGELVYAGPNVMLGYAETPADLGLGRTVDELRTGDLARRAADGLYEIVGRRGRFLKILGLRIDPQEVEAALAGHGVSAICAGTDRELVVAVPGDLDPAYVRRLVTAACGLPPGAVRVLAAEPPRLPSGKPDRRAVLELAAKADAAPAREPAPVPRQRDRTRADLRELYAEILDRDDVTDDSSFVGLGGDSLSYVEMSVRLERTLGHLPPNWHTLPIRDLRPPARATGSRRRALETSVALRAVAIVLVVGTHAGLFNVSGGAHLLLGVAGFNFARFHLIDTRRRERLRHVWSSIARLASPGSPRCSCSRTTTARPACSWCTAWPARRTAPGGTSGSSRRSSTCSWPRPSCSPCRPSTGSSAGGRTGCPWRSRRSAWSPGTTCWACAPASTCRPPCWCSGSSPSAGPPRRPARPGSAWW
jgi:acyl-CoA synthetase (AMP-forming)/AMP-acid ligase II